MRRTKFFFLLVASVFILIQGKTSENAPQELGLIHDNDATRKDEDIQEVKSVSEPHDDNDNDERNNEVEVGNSVLETQTLLADGAGRRYGADSTSRRRQNYRFVDSEYRNDVCKNRYRNTFRRHVPENRRSRDQLGAHMRHIQAKEFQRRTRINERRENNDRRLLRRAAIMERQDSDRTIDRQVRQRRELQLATRRLDNNKEKRDARRSDRRNSSNRLARENRELRKSVRLIEEARVLNGTVSDCSVLSVDYSNTRTRSRLDTRDLHTRLKAEDEDVMHIQRKEVKRIRSNVERATRQQGRGQEYSTRRMSSADVRRMNSPSSDTNVQRRNFQGERINSIRRSRNNNGVSERSAVPSSRRDLRRRDSFNVRQKREEVDLTYITRDLRRLSIGRDTRRLIPSNEKSFSTNEKELDTTFMKQYAAERRVDIRDNRRRTNSPIQNRLEKRLHDDDRLVTFRMDKDMARRTQFSFRHREVSVTYLTKTYEGCACFNDK